MNIFPLSSVPNFAQAGSAPAGNTSLVLLLGILTLIALAAAVLTSHKEAAFNPVELCGPKDARKVGE
ncbi:MAG: hypothetical protein KGL04_03540 [Elusimicrobia bacterium]|nr:hypothetical protein [Elusimicrobiota bacterium]MDE2313229.1 hypothetical protein [Elusimicrobiota bacterium]